MQNRPEFLAGQLTCSVELDQMRREEAAVRMALAQLASFHDACFAPHPRHMLRQGRRAPSH